MSTQAKAKFWLAFIGVGLSLMGVDIVFRIMSHEQIQTELETVIEKRFQVIAADRIEQIQKLELRVKELEER